MVEHKIEVEIDASSLAKKFKDVIKESSSKLTQSFTKVEKKVFATGKQIDRDLYKFLSKFLEAFSTPPSLQPYTSLHTKFAKDVLKELGGGRGVERKIGRLSEEKELRENFFSKIEAAIESKRKEFLDFSKKLKEEETLMEALPKRVELGRDLIDDLKLARERFVNLMPSYNDLMELNKRQKELDRFEEKFLEWFEEQRKKSFEKIGRLREEIAKLDAVAKKGSKKEAEKAEQKIKKLREKILKIEQELPTREEAYFQYRQEHWKQMGDNVARRVINKFRARGLRVAELMKSFTPLLEEITQQTIENFRTKLKFGREEMSFIEKAVQASKIETFKRVKEKIYDLIVEYGGGDINKQQLGSKVYNTLERSVFKIFKENFVKEFDEIFTKAMESRLKLFEHQSKTKLRAVEAGLDSIHRKIISKIVNVKDIRKLEKDINLLVSSELEALRKIKVGNEPLLEKHHIEKLKKKIFENITSKVKEKVESLTPIEKELLKHSFPAEINAVVVTLGNHITKESERITRQLGAQIEYMAAYTTETMRTVNNNNVMLQELLSRFGDGSSVIRKLLPP